jgi:glycine dehydrogenase subunit 1
MSFNPHTPQDRETMLATVGAESTDELFAPIPADVRYPHLDLPPALTEMEATRHLAALAAKDFVPEPEDSYLGAGSYRHFIPSTVDAMISRGEFFTAYTPYQPEVAQGTLQVIYEFQSMVAELMGMEVANASMYDGATAMAEGALIAVSSTRKRERIVVSPTVNPAYRKVLETYISGTSITSTTLPARDDPLRFDVSQLEGALDDGVACVVVQYPNFYGTIEDIEAIAEVVHGAGALLVVNTTPVPLALLRSPGELGADIATAEGQPLGVPPSYGGPYVGLLATSKKHVRQMPGRLAGITTDEEGKRGFVLTLQTREQHIRREKATSNICTNQGLMATAATVYMSTLGPEGFREVANRSYQNAHYLAQQVAAKPGYSIASPEPFFHELTIRCPIPAAEGNRALLDRGILGGLDLGTVDPALADCLLTCTTELHSRESIYRLVEALPTGR